MPAFTCFFALVALVPAVLGHGQVNHVVVNGNSSPAPNIYYGGAEENTETAVRVMYQASSPSFVLPTGFNDPSKMSCEGSASAGAPHSISVGAGQTVSIFWEGATGELMGEAGLTAYNPWVHAMGPIMDYITECDGDCSSFDATNAGWVKIAESGLDTSQWISDELRERMTNKPEPYYPSASSGSGLWAMAKMLQAGSKWDVTIPSSLKPGNYILRNELSAVHNPKNADPTTGPQLYIACIQLSVTGSGSTSLPAGTKSSDLYDPNGDFANYNVISDVYSFKLPGPAVWDGASSGDNNNNNNGNNNNGGNNGGNGGGNNNPAPTTTDTPAAPTTTTTPAAAPATTSTPSAPGSTGHCKRASRRRELRRETRRAAFAAQHKRRMEH